MQSLAWEMLFRAIPEEQQNNVILITRAGVEISIQCLLRIEPECIVIRGRLSGSQDAGRVFFIPYQQIDNIGFFREMKEADFHAMFSDLTFPGRPGTAMVEALSADDDPAEEVGTPVVPGAIPASRMDIPIKSEVLERFRNRSGNGRPGG